VRFHARFGLDGWLWLLLGTFEVFSSLRGHFGLKAPGISMLGVAAGCIIALVPLLRCYFLYWEIEPESLRERAFLAIKHEIPWASITRVAQFTPGSDDDTLAVWYTNPKSKSGSSYLTARPVQRQQFLDSVHKYAPSVTIDVKHS
jgi:hypothetical protein